MPILSCQGEGNTAAIAIGEIDADTAESTNLCMRGHSKRENREVLLVSVFNRWQSHQTTERSENASGGKSDMNADRNSDDFVVPTKWANKTGTPVAESMEGRRSPKSRSVRLAVTPDTVPDPVTDCESTGTACSDVYIVTVTAQRRSRMR